MEFKIQDYSKLCDLNGSVNSSFKTVDNKTKKLLWDSMLEVYEKEAPGDCKELDVSELDEWGKKTQGTFQVLPIVIQAKPDMIRALPGWLEEEPLGESNKIEVSCRKKRKTPAIKNLSKTKDVIKVSEKTTGKRKRRQEKNNSTKNKSPKHSIDKTIENNPTKIKKVQKYSENLGSSECSCSLQLRYSNTIENTVVRSDRRVFSCKLIFRVCECSKSDERF
ncbi:hypothetical protein J6590_095119 [Homalodisca vitripennis]|nr:hypothetical protein J6590_095119 [Homalodisca vitripennis]